MWGPTGRIGIIALVIVLVTLSPLSGGLVRPAGSSTASPSHPSGTVPTIPSPSVGSHPPAPSAQAATEKRILNEVQASHVPSKYVYLPNFHAEGTKRGGVVAPTYSHSPAPLGIAAMGVSNTTGTSVGTILNSPSYEGSITFDQLNEFYLDDDSADYIGAQLNTVVSNVTLFGVTNYSFWNQNVITYSARSNLLQFIDNIWNFSDPNFFLSPNVFNQTSPNGTLIAPTFYYALGPVINITMPFTLHLYINASVTNVDGLPNDIVWFNYTVIKSGATVAAGTFDWAIFNSQDPANPLANIPDPVYQVNGINLSPTGYLPYDSELVLCGPGGGSTTTVLNIAATMNLLYLNTSTDTYQNVPSAFAYGTNTGETIEGATEWFDATNTVHVGPGPTLPVPLWNASPSASPGFISVHGAVSPDTSFVFMNQSSSFNASWAAWAPVPIGGVASYNVPLANYTGEILMANYDRAWFNVTGGTPSTYTISGVLTGDPSTGLYTPLNAFSDSQLGELAVSGGGTLGSPYLLPNNEGPSLDPIFGSINDFGFPVFAGLLLVHTNAYVLIDHGATYGITYADRVLHYMNVYGLPTSNHLQMELYGTSHVTIWNTTGISGWLDGETLTGFPLASLMLWNTTHTLIGGNTFASQGTTILAYGGSGNTIWGNWFNTDALVMDPVYGFDILSGPLPMGPQIYESGDLIYNNAFLTEIPAYSPAGTIYYETFYSSFNTSWVDAWNVSAMPASDTTVVNGIDLNGSITGGLYQGGNLWWNWGQMGYYLPFDGYGLIAVGGDWLPLGGDTVTFTESGLPDGTPWTFSVGALSVTTTGTTASLSLYAGTFSYTVTPLAGYTNTPSAGTLTLTGAPTGVAVLFTWAGSYPLSFLETGLPIGTIWTVTVNGVVQSSNLSAIVFAQSNGSYTWRAAPVAGYFESPGSGSGFISGNAQTVTIGFNTGPTAEYALTFVEVGLPAGTLWSVTIAGTPVSGTDDTLTASEPNGSYDYTVGTVTGFTAGASTGTATIAGGSTSVTITWTPLPGTILGTVTPATASLTVDGLPITVSSTGTFTISVSPGVHSIQASASGYFGFYDNVSVAPAASKVVTIAMNSQSSGSTTTGLSGGDLALVTGVGVLAVLFLIGMLYFWSQSRRPAVVMRPESPPSPGAPPP